MRRIARLNFLKILPFLAAGLLFLFPLDKLNAQEIAPAEKFLVYQTVLPEKSLLTSPQFIVIDDFNTGKLKNQRGFPWQTKVPAFAVFDLSTVREDARNSKRGYSLKIDFRIMPSAKASLQSSLNRLDVSQAKYFVLKYKIRPAQAETFKGRLRLTLTDWKYRVVTQDITSQFPAVQNEWAEVIFSMTSFKGLDLDQLLQLEISVIAREEEIRGELWLDEVAFFGFNDTGFESHRDNLAGFPKTVVNSRRAARLREETDNNLLLKAIAYDTWKYFENARDRKTNLVVDHIRLGDSPLAADYTSPTNIAMDLLSIVSAMELEFISRQEAVKKVGRILKTLKKLRRYKGFFYNFYDTKKLNITRSYISTVDSGWLAAAFVVIRQTFPNEYGRDLRLLIDSFSFDSLLDTENNQLVVGIDVPERNFGSYHYGMLVSEARVTSFYAIGKGDIPQDHWWFLYRTPPKAWKWQNQKPKGRDISRDGVDYFQGYYKHGHFEFVPSWGGSLFEFLMPTLILKEKTLAPHGLGLNNKIATMIQRDYALKEKKYPVWGISPAAITSGKRWSYAEFGVKTLSVKGYPDRGVVTPHVSFLALETLPEDAVLNIRNLLKFNELYGEYGFFDAINLINKKINYQYLALDQGMTLVAICNYLKNGAIQNKFHADVIAKRAEELLVKESFFNS